MSARRLLEERAQRACERYFGQLRLELSLGTPRRHLDVIVDLLRWLVPLCGRNQLATIYADELRGLEARVKTRTNLRLVGGRR